MSAGEVSSNTLPSFQFRRAVLALSFALWVGSLALPALISPSPRNTLWGIEILLWGWLGIAGVEDRVGLLGVLAWWANPFYLWALIKASGRGRNPAFSANMALGLATLTVLLGSYAVNAVPVFTPVIGYGPGALLWYLAIVSLAYVSARDRGGPSSPRLLLGLAGAVCAFFVAFVLWRAVASNTSERERLPFYSAKRGFICSAEAKPLPIVGPQPAIALEAESKYWLDSLRNWRVAAVQVGSTEYSAAAQGSPESKKPPFMASRPVSVRARYTLQVDGGYPYINKWSDGGDFVRMTLIDNQTKTQIGELIHHREMNRRVGFCPSLTYFPHSRNEEAIRWLAPFFVQQ